MGQTERGGGRTLRLALAGPHGSHCAQGSLCFHTGLGPALHPRVTLLGPSSFNWIRFSPQTECFNFICFLQPYNASHLYVCGTYAFQPKCAYIVSAALPSAPPRRAAGRWASAPHSLSLPAQDMVTFTLEHGAFEDGKGKCPYDPAKGHTALLVGEWPTPLKAGMSPRICSHLGLGPECISPSLWPG